jgi:hypothetical protein
VEVQDPRTIAAAIAVCAIVRSASIESTSAPTGTFGLCALTGGGLMAGADTNPLAGAGTPRSGRTKRQGFGRTDLIRRGLVQEGREHCAAQHTCKWSWVMAGSKRRTSACCHLGWVLPSTSAEIYRMLYRWGCMRCVGGISRPAGREGPINMFVSDVNIHHTKGPLTGVSAGQGPFQHVVAGEGFKPSKLSRWIYSPKAASL